MNNQNEVSFAGKFEGKFKLSAENLAIMAVNYLGATEAQAIRLGKSYSSDWGQLTRQGSEIADKIGKIDKENGITGKDIETVIVSGYATNSIRIAKLLREVDKCRKHGMVYQGTSISMIKELTEWFTQTGKFAPEVKEPTQKPTLVNA